jgi:hypothetical protein
VFEQLDRVSVDVGDDVQVRALTETVVVSGAVAAAGYVVLNTRVVYWFLSALLARPAIWRRFDPLDVIYAWERERVDQTNDPADPESLQTLVN